MFSLDLMPSPRILKPGPRPFIAFGVMLALLLVLPLYTGIAKGQWTDAAQLAGWFLGTFAILCFFVSSTKLTVTGESIAFRRGLAASRRVDFRDITASVPLVLGERDWPVSLAIYCDDPKQPTLILPLKPFRQADVTQLLSMPELRVRQPGKV